VTRLRAGEWLAGLGGAGLFVLMFFGWFGADLDAIRFDADRHGSFGAGGLLNTLSTYSTNTATADGWSSLGWFMVVLVCLQLLGAGMLVYLTVKRASPAWPVGAGVLTWILGSAIWLVLVLRVCVFQPGPDALIAVHWAAYAGLACSALIPLGGLLSIRNERTRTPESLAYMPPPARTAPGA
jgi:hypothetical protein